MTSAIEIAAFLREDRLYAAYALGDLDPEYMPSTEWYGADLTGRLQTLALIYRGFDPPVLFVMGEPDGLAVVLGSALREPRVNFTALSEHLQALQAFYRMFDPAAMWRMAVRATAFAPAASDAVRRLYPGDARQLEALYALARTTPGEHRMAFAPAQLAQGVFYGIRVKGELVAAAGTHLVSRGLKIAAVGNVFTHPGHRRQGYALACTSAVTAELFAQGVIDVVLNVARDNVAATAVYERLGYTRACPFHEGLAVRKS